MSFAAKIDDDIQNILNNVEPLSNAPVTTNHTNAKGILNSKNNFNNNNSINSDSESCSSSVVHDDDDVVFDIDVHDENDDYENDNDNNDDYSIDDEATDDSDTSSRFAENQKDNKNNTNNKDAAPFLSITDKKEKTRLKISKFLFIGSILLVGVIICSITYWILNKNETADSEESVSR